MLKNTKYIIWSAIFLFFLLLIPNNFLHAQVASVDLKINGSDGPVSVVDGGSFVLSWNSEYVSSCTGTNFTATGSAVSGSITESTSVGLTYTINCVSSLNPAVTVSDNVTVSSYEYDPPSCGVADGKYTFAEPTADLCSVGTAGTVTSSGGLFSWACVKPGYSDSDYNDLVVEVRVGCTGSLSTENYLDTTVNEFWSSGEIDFQEILDSSDDYAGFDKNNDQTEIKSWSCDGDTTLNIKYIGNYGNRPALFGYYTDEDLSTVTPVFRTQSTSGADVDPADFGVPLASANDEFSINLGNVPSVGFSFYSWGGSNYNKYTNNDSLSRSGWDQIVVYNPSSGLYLMGMEDFGGGSRGPQCSTVNLPEPPPPDIFCGTGQEGFFSGNPTGDSVLCDASVGGILSGSVTTPSSSDDYYNWSCFSSDDYGTSFTSTCQGYKMPECGSPQYTCDRGDVVDDVNKKILEDGKTFQWSCFNDIPLVDNDFETTQSPCTFTCDSGYVAVGTECQDIGQITIKEFKPTQRIINQGDSCDLTWTVEIKNLDDPLATSTCALSGGASYSANYTGAATTTRTYSDSDVQANSEYYLYCNINGVTQAAGVTNTSDTTSCSINPTIIEN